MIIDPALAPTSTGDRGLATLHLSVAGGITRFRASIDTLAPGGWSSHRHWHETEDEFVYVLSGEATVIDDDGAHVLHPGDAAAWRRGDPNAHHLTNRGSQPLRYLCVGSRAARDVCHYPDSGRTQINDETTWQLIGPDGAVLREGDLPDELLDLPPVWGSAFDPTVPARRILPAASVTGVAGSDYPPEFNDLGDYTVYPLSDEGGLTQFGAFRETLMPGARSSQRHWHETEDEFLLVLDGTVTLVDDDGPTAMQPGMSAAWPAGVANGHCLRNDSDTPVTYLVVGARLADDTCHYPDIDLHYVRKNGQRAFLHKDGTPYPGWPKGAVR